MVLRRAILHPDNNPSSLCCGRISFARCTKEITSHDNICMLCSQHSIQCVLFLFHHLSVYAYQWILDKDGRDEGNRLPPKHFCGFDVRLICSGCHHRLDIRTPANMGHREIADKQEQEDGIGRGDGCWSHVCIRLSTNDNLANVDQREHSPHCSPTLHSISCTLGRLPL